jgi:hypothetical protein
MHEDDTKYCLQGIILVGYGLFSSFSETFTTTDRLKLSSALLFGV